MKRLECKISLHVFSYLLMHLRIIHIEPDCGLNKYRYTIDLLTYTEPSSDMSKTNIPPVPPVLSKRSNLKILTARLIKRCMLPHLNFSYILKINKDLGNLRQSKILLSHSQCPSRRPSNNVSRVSPSFLRAYSPFRQMRLIQTASSLQMWDCFVFWWCGYYNFAKYVQRIWTINDQTGYANGIIGSGM